MNIEILRVSGQTLLQQTGLSSNEHDTAVLPEANAKIYTEKNAVSSVQEQIVKRSLPPPRPTQIPYLPTAENVTKLKEYIMKVFSTSAFLNSDERYLALNVPPFKILNLLQLRWGTGQKIHHQHQQLHFRLPSYQWALRKLQTYNNPELKESLEEGDNQYNQCIIIIL